MGVHIKIPHEDGHMVDVEITEDLGMVFYDYDIEYDLGAREFGYPTTLCAAAFDMWDTHPMTFFCSSGLIPISNMGVVSCRLVQDALAIVRSHQEFECFDEVGKLIKASLKNWNPKRKAVQELHTRKLELYGCWNRSIRNRRTDYGKDPTMPSFADVKIVDASIECADFVLGFWEATELTGGFFIYPSQLCDIIKMAQSAIAYVLYKPILEERHRFFGTDFQDVLKYPPDDFVVLLDSIEKDQARLAVKILETLP